MPKFTPSGNGGGGGGAAASNPLYTIVSSTFENIARFTTSGWASPAFAGNGVTMTTSATANRSQTLALTGIGSGNRKPMRSGGFNWAAMIIPNSLPDAGKNGDTFIGSSRSLTVSGGAGGIDFDSYPQIGFKIVTVNGVSKLYATNSGGAAETATEITGVTLEAFQNYYLGFKATADSIEFYVDNVLVATHTENIPAAEDELDLFFMAVSNKNTAFAVAYWVEYFSAQIKVSD